MCRVSRDGVISLYRGSGTLKLWWSHSIYGTKIVLVALKPIKILQHSTVSATWGSHMEFREAILHMETWNIWVGRDLKWKRPSNFSSLAMDNSTFH